MKFQSTTAILLACLLSGVLGKPVGEGPRPSSPTGQSSGSLGTTAGGKTIDASGKTTGQGGGTFNPNIPGNTPGVTNKPGAVPAETSGNYGEPKMPGFNQGDLPHASQAGAGFAGVSGGPAAVGFGTEAVSAAYKQQGIQGLKTTEQIASDAKGTSSLPGQKPGPIDPNAQKGNQPGPNVQQSGSGGIPIENPMFGDPNKGRR
ncbi:Hypothetical protein D9617_7g029250 [Elsinoe fawcettii]|nr:Hypothetical protein D9617_7g029250 [Elsinoe fawcettii]